MIFPFALYSGFSSICMRAWWPLGDEDEDVNGHNGGEEKRDLGRTTPSVLPPKSPCTANTSRPPREPILQMDTDSGPMKAVEHLGRDLRDVEPSSLLAQPHIRTLLVIDGLYSVCSFLRQSLSGLVSVSARRSAGGSTKSFDSRKSEFRPVRVFDSPILGGLWLVAHGKVHCSGCSSCVTRWKIIQTDPSISRCSDTTSPPDMGMEFGYGVLNGAINQPYKHYSCYFDISSTSANPLLIILRSVYFLDLMRRSPCGPSALSPRAAWIGQVRK